MKEARCVCKAGALAVQSVWGLWQRRMKGRREKAKGAVGLDKAGRQAWKVRCRQGHGARLAV